MTLFAIVGVIASRIVFQAYAAHDAAVLRAELAGDLNNAMDRITTELRTMGQKAGTTPAAPDISALTASSITFGAGGSTRTITLTGSNLQLTAETGTAVLAGNVTAFTLQAYDTSNAALPASPTAAQLLTARRVQITLTATKNSVTETLRTKVFLRCVASGSGAS